MADKMIAQLFRVPSRWEPVRWGIPRFFENYWVPNEYNDFWNEEPYGCVLMRWIPWPWGNEQVWIVKEKSINQADIASV